MDSVMAFVTPAYNFVHAGFSDVKSQVAAVLIAIVAAILMKSWGRIWGAAIGAVVVHYILLVVLLPLLSGGSFRLQDLVPDFLSLQFLASLAALFVGYVLVIAFFFFLKHNVFRMGRPRHAHGHGHGHAH